MAANDYHFITKWRVTGTVEEVSDVLGDASDLCRWWPSVYLDMTEIEPGEANGVGKVVDLLTKGWLPYTLRWRFRVTETRRPYGFSLVATGDFDGRGVWTFTQDGPEVDIEYDWRITANKPLLKYLSFLMKPLFSANHRWAMARGLESLKIELIRRRAATPEKLAAIPQPPPPSATSVAGAAAILAGTLATVAAVIVVVKRRR